jgi:hypothetical protein
VLKLPVGLGKSGRTGRLGVPQMPEHTATNNGREVHLVGETVAVLFIDQEIDGQGEPTPGEHDHERPASECANEAIERLGGDMTDDRAEFQTEAPWLAISASRATSGRIWR